MTSTRLSLTSALMLGTSSIALSPAFAADCGTGTDCLPPSPAYCTGDDATSSERRCGPLRDNGTVDRQAVEPNLETGPAGANPDGFRVSIDGASSDPLVLPQVADIMRVNDVKAPALALGDGEGTVRTLIQVDTLHADPAISVVAARPAVAPGESIAFFTMNNYARFTDRAEILIYRGDDGRSAGPFARLTATIGAPALWTPTPGTEGSYRYVMRVYAPSGRYDETAPQSLLVTSAVSTDMDEDRTGPLLENQRVVSDISVRGTMVRVSGSNVPAGATVELYGATVPVSADGTFVAEQIVPTGTTDVSYLVRAADGSESRVTRPIQIRPDDRFFVGIADITAGHRGINNDAAYAELQGSGGRIDRRDDFVDGRLAFYLRSSFDDRYRVTASADTGEQPLNRLFSQFGDKDPRALLRRLDPQRHYPVYGDDSTTVEDAPTYGRFYARLESPNGEILWGNFQTQLTGSELIPYARGLYGSKVAWRSDAVTSFGERRTDITGFAADPGTVGSREEFQSTGGSLYYLRRQDVVQGSERVFVETRDRDSGLVLDRRELAPARDYDVNYLQGRLILRDAAPITANGSQFVRGTSIGGNPVYVVVNYEYSPGLDALSSFTVGGRASQWLGDHVRVGGTAYHQGEDQAQQDLYGGDLILRYRPGTYLKGEIARSSGAGDGTILSGSGGYDFVGVTAAGNRADAIAIEAAADLSELGTGRGRIGGYWRQRDAGFSGPGQLTGANGVDQFGGTLSLALGNATTLIGKADIIEGGYGSRAAAEAGLAHNLGDGWFAEAGVRFDEHGNGAATASPLLNERGGRTDGAVTVGYRSAGHAAVPAVPEGIAAGAPAPVARPGDAGAAAQADGDGDRHPWSLYAFGQATIAADGTRRSNDRVGIGGDVQLSQRTRLSGEVSDGSLGNAVRIGGEYRISERGSINLGYAFAAENPDAFSTGRLGRLTATTRYRFSDAMSVFGEGRYEHGSGPTGLTQAYGVDFAPSHSWRFGVRAERGALSDPFTGDIRRTALGSSVDFTGATARFSSALEYRNDRGNVIGRRSTVAMRNTLTVSPDTDWRLFAKANFARSQGPDGNDALDANYTELVAAAAYRPVRNDALNLLGKFTYLYDLPTAGLVNVPGSGQLSGRGGVVDYAQRSRVFALDATYQLSPAVSVGGKIAARTGELRPSRTPGTPWFAATATFLAVRADLRIVREWDAMAELRSLRVSEAGDSRVGALVGVYRHMGDHVKIGVGYNFTDFSDDLTDLSYNENGVFLNVIGKF